MVHDYTDVLIEYSEKLEKMICGKSVLVQKRVQGESDFDRKFKANRL